MKLLSLESEIAHAQGLLSQALLQSAFTENHWGKVNCMGGKFESELHYSPQFNLWYLYELRDGKHWNAFGEGKPGQKALRIHCEINLAAGGIQRAMAAAFAQDDDGHLFLLHRGKIRGGKALFFQHYTGQKVNVTDGKGTEEMALVASLNQKEQVAAQIADFIAQVLYIKAQKQ